MELFESEIIFSDSGDDLFSESKRQVKSTVTSQRIPINAAAPTQKLQIDNISAAAAASASVDDITTSMKKLTMNRAKKSQVGDDRSSSAPMMIPGNAVGVNSRRRKEDYDDDDEEEEEFSRLNHNRNIRIRADCHYYSEIQRMVPPHVILAKRIAMRMTSSVHIGNGTALRGRNLDRVRNTILRMTGFLES